VKEIKELVNYAPQDGPDGLVVDADGNVWVAVRDATRPGIYAYTPEGEEKAYIPTPVPTNVGFGRGDHSNILYITASNHLYRIKVGKRGYHLP
jgi:gluconolactonase